MLLFWVWQPFFTQRADQPCVRQNGPSTLGRSVNGDEQGDQQTMCLVESVSLLYMRPERSRNSYSYLHVGADWDADHCAVIRMLTGKGANSQDEEFVDKGEYLKQKVDDRMCACV